MNPIHNMGPYVGALNPTIWMLDNITKKTTKERNMDTNPIHDMRPSIEDVKLNCEQDSE